MQQSRQGFGGINRAAILIALGSAVLGALIVLAVIGVYSMTVKADSKPVVAPISVPAAAEKPSTDPIAATAAIATGEGEVPENEEPVGDGDMYAVQEGRQPTSAIPVFTVPAVPSKQTGLVGRWGQGVLQIWFREDGTFHWKGSHGFTEGTWRVSRGEIGFAFPEPYSGSMEQYGGSIPGGAQVVIPYRITGDTLQFRSRTVYAPGEVPSTYSDPFELERMRDWSGNPL